MASSLTGVGVLWAGLSVTFAITSCVGFYSPHWLQGVLLNSTETNFGPFRRCNFPRLTAEGVQIIQECGRYSSFGDIPSIWWQFATVTAGSGCILGLLVAVTTGMASCMPQVLHSESCKAMGFLQLAACHCIILGMAVYPVGWGNREVLEACGPKATVYNPGQCSVSWSYYLLGVSAGGLLVCFAMSTFASHVKPGSLRL